MCSPDSLTANMRKHKSALTRAQNTGDPVKVIAACVAAFESFDSHGWPDCWSRWENACMDAKLAVHARMLAGDYHA